MRSVTKVFGLWVLGVGLPLMQGCASATPTGESEDDLRTPTAVVELALGRDGRCAMRSPNPTVKLDRVVRLRNVGDEPIAALIELWDNSGGMPAPEGGDIEPGKFVSVKMTTRWWRLEDDPESRSWSTAIVCKRGLWSDESVDFEEVGRVEVRR